MGNDAGQPAREFGKSGFANRGAASLEAGSGATVRACPAGTIWEKLIFDTHYLDHPHQGDSQVLGGWSYLWAGLFGPFYVLAKGFTRAAIKMAFYSLLIYAVGFLAIALVSVTFFKASSIIVAIAAIVTVLSAVQARIAVRLVLIAYLQIGYREGYY